MPTLKEIFKEALVELQRVDEGSPLTRFVVSRSRNIPGHASVSVYPSVPPDAEQRKNEEKETHQAAYGG